MTTQLFKIGLFFVDELNKRSLWYAVVIIQRNDPGKMMESRPPLLVFPSFKTPIPVHIGFVKTIELVSNIGY